MKNGTARDCFATRFLRAPETKSYGQTQTYFALGSLMEAGSDTSRMTISQVMAAAVLDKRWVHTARAALDKVCGGGDSDSGSLRLPNFDDRADLPYITATVKEAFRWRPFAEIGVPHMLVQDDEYEGYRFPAGTLFTWNATAIALDPSEYEQPERFWPERFLNDDLDHVLKGHWSFGPGNVCSCSAVQFSLSDTVQDDVCAPGTTWENRTCGSWWLDCSTASISRASRYATPSFTISLRTTN